MSVGSHSHSEYPWRVWANGVQVGSGVLLDRQHALTCYHVAGDGTDPVTVKSAVCRPPWESTARVVRWRGEKEGDLALLRLDCPAPCDGGTKLWCVPLSGGTVRTYGFPGPSTGSEPDGISVTAELGGSGGRRGEFGLLNPVGDNRQWIEPGFSGAGVVMLDGDHRDQVIGLVVRKRHDDAPMVAWMTPTETIRKYLPEIRPYVSGVPTELLGPASEGPLPGLPGDDALPVALTRELRALLTSGWTGTVVLPDGAATAGTKWLVRLIRTADPATRAGTSPAELSSAPSGTSLEIGHIDAALDVRGMSVAEILDYLAKRFGLSAGEPDLIDRLWRRKPPPCLVIVGIDRAQSSELLIRDVLRPLAVRARSRGLRLVLGFDETPPSFPHEVLLDWAPLPAVPAATASAADAAAAVDGLAAAEDDVARFHAEIARMFRHVPLLLSAQAPRLRVRLAVAGEQGTAGELAAIAAAASATAGDVAAFRARLERMRERLQDLRATLDAHQAHAEQYFDAEDTRLQGAHRRASQALWEVPVDLDAADAAVNRYAAAVKWAIDERDDGEEDPR